MLIELERNKGDENLMWKHSRMPRQQAGCLFVDSQEKAINENSPTLTTVLCADRF
jgi:hypothetical protein